MVLNNGIFKRIVKVGALCEGDIRRFIPYKRLECVALLLCGFPDRATATVGPPLYRGIFLDQKCANHNAIPIWPIQSNSSCSRIEMMPISFSACIFLVPK